MDELKRCVVIDDDADYLEQVRRCFAASRLDYHVVTFTSSVTAADYIRQHHVDLILTAYLLPQMDGLQFISLVRASNARVPILMLSRVPIKAVALARGATAFLAKAALWTHLGNTIRGLGPAHA